MDGISAGPCETTVMTKRRIFEIMRQHKNANFNEQLDLVEKYLVNNETYSDLQKSTIKHKFSSLKSTFKSKWNAAQKKEERFLKNNETWLQGTFEIPKMCNKRVGRPRKTFTNLSERSKRRKTEKLQKESDSQEILYAAQLKLNKKGKRVAAKILKEMVHSPTRAKKYKTAYQKLADKPRLPAMQALAMFVEAELTRKQYNVIRCTNKLFYPSYSVIQKAKRICYPSEDAYHVTATCAEVQLQDLMELTVRRLLIHLEEKVQTLSEEDATKLTLICKWGCDGSQQSQYKQKFDNEYDSDANIFQSCFVPLELKCTSGKVIWQNPTPSSPRYCRPIRIRFLKETTDITQEEIKYIENAAKSLDAIKVTVCDKQFQIKCTMILTMVDAKVWNAATNTTSTMKCYICGATSKDFNNLLLKPKINEESLRFGLSVLHTRIRAFESLLHLSYKLPVAKWQIRSEEDKLLVKRRKSEIQKHFKQKLGLIVDVPKHGFGNTNDGNTSRRFFTDLNLGAEITCLDYKLMYRIKVILEVISSGQHIDINKFEIFAMETAKLYVNLYPWHPMTPTMHKLLIHGAVIIKQALLPIGQLSEEAAEARNKHFRQYRQSFSRKCSREACNRDVLNRLLLSSDPVITGLRRVHTKKTKPLLPETVALLVGPHAIEEEGSSEAQASSDEDESISD